MRSSASGTVYPPDLKAKIVGLTKCEIGTTLLAAPAFVNHGALFTRVIVALLFQAQRPELKHLGVVANDEPCAYRQSWKGTKRQPLTTCKEDRYRDKPNGHPC
jgi:hypothetical protein